MMPQKNPKLISLGACGSEHIFLRLSLLVSILKILYRLYCRTHIFLTILTEFTEKCIEIGGLWLKLTKSNFTLASHCGMHLSVGPGGGIII